MTTHQMIGRVQSVTNGGQLARPRRAREPNTRLRELIAEARWTGQGLARAVDAAGGEIGLSLTYDRTAVAHWLGGSRPPARVASLVAEVFSRRLGRVVTVRDTGLGAPGVGIPWQPDPHSDHVTELVELCSADADPSHRGALRELVYNVAAVKRATEISASPFIAGDPADSHRAQAVRTMVRLFSTADGLFGGGHIRHALTAYLAGDAVRWLRGSRREDAGRGLTAAVGELSYLAAFVCFDSCLQGLAQRYYVASLGLAAEAGDAALQSTVLRGMSVQAYGLRHHRDAYQLAEAAVDIGGRGVPLAPARAAGLAGQLAVAAAADGRRRAAAAHLLRAEDLLRASEPSDEPVGAYHISALCYHEAEVRAAAGDARGAIDVLSSSIRQRPGAERRSRLVTVARLAQLQLDVGHLDAACATIDVLRKDYPYLHSPRVEGMLDSLRTRLLPYSRSREVRAALDGIRTLRGQDPGTGAHPGR